MDYVAKIEDLKGAIAIKKKAHQSTAVLDHKLIMTRTRQLQAIRRAERKSAKAKQ